MQRTFFGGVGKDDGEFLTAVAAGDIAFTAQTLLQGLGHPPQGVVAGLVAEPVVEGLEVIHVQHQ
ncbi:hypothetical protein D3C76_1779430 [compost metagenome]